MRQPARSRSDTAVTTAMAGSRLAISCANSVSSLMRSPFGLTARTSPHPRPHRRTARTAADWTRNVLPRSEVRMSSDSAAPSVLAGLGDTRPWQEELYRDVHAHPELSHQEHRTAGLVAE